MSEAGTERGIAPSQFEWLLIAGLVLFGMSYGVKVGAHIGVDAFVKKMSTPVQRVVGIAAALLCMAYGAIVFVGSWNLVDFVYVLDIDGLIVRVLRADFKRMSFGSSRLSQTLNSLSRNGQDGARNGTHAHRDYQRP